MNKTNAKYWKVGKKINLEKYNKVKKTIKDYQKFIKDNFKYVGDNFAYEARSVSYTHLRAHET